VFRLCRRRWERNPRKCPRGLHSIGGGSLEQRPPRRQTL
ncbi:hypothetical protein ETH_00037775, partial [Eimeria tenella]